MSRFLEARSMTVALPMWEERKETFEPVKQPDERSWTLGKWDPSIFLCAGLIICFYLQLQACIDDFRRIVRVLLLDITKGSLQQASLSLSLR